MGTNQKFNNYENSRIQVNTITSSMLKYTVQKIVELKPDVLNEEDFSTYQFVLDILKKNYKIDKKSYKNFLIGIAYFVIPMEDIMKLIFGRFSLLFTLTMLPIDEYMMTKHIMNIINDELENYLKFIRKPDYKEATFEEVALEQLVNVKELTSSVLKAMKKLQNDEVVIATTDLVDVTMKRNKSIEEVILFQEKDYMNIVTEYIKNATVEFVTVDYKKLKNQVIFNEMFNIEICQEVVQNKMKDQLESSKDKMHTYRLKNLVSNNYSYLKNGISKISENNDNTINVNDTVIFEVDANENFATAIASIIAKTNQSLNGRTKSVVARYNDLIVEVDIKNNFKTNIITSNVENTEIITTIEKEITSYYNKNKIKQATKQIADITQISKNQVAIVQEEDIDFKVESAVRKIQRINDADVTVSLKDFNKFISNSNVKNKEKYLIACQNVKDVKRIGKKDITIVENEQVVNNILSDSAKEMTFDDVVITCNIPGCLDDRHLAEIQEKVFEAQIIAKESPNQNLSLLINGANNILINFDLTNTIPVKIIDITGQMAKDKLDQIKKVLSSDAYLQNKMIYN